MPRKRRQSTDEVTVVLIAPHRHEGQSFEKDEPVKVRRGLLPTLERMGVIAAGTAEGDAPAPVPSFDPVPDTPDPDATHDVSAAEDDHGDEPGSIDGHD